MRTKGNTNSLSQGYLRAQNIAPPPLPSQRAKEDASNGPSVIAKSQKRKEMSPKSPSFTPAKEKQKEVTESANEINDERMKRLEVRARTFVLSVTLTL